MILLINRLYLFLFRTNVIYVTVLPFLDVPILIIRLSSWVRESISFDVMLRTLFRYEQKYPLKITEFGNLCVSLQ